MQRYAHTATVDVEGDEYEVGVNTVTIYVIPVFNDGLYGYTLGFTDGLPTEDSDECHTLNVEFGDADPGDKSESWYLSRDAGVKVDDEYTTITFGDGLEFQFGDNGSVHGTVTVKDPNPRHLHVLDGPELVYNADGMEVRV